MRAPQVKPLHDPVRFDSGLIRIGGGLFPVASELEDPSGLVWRLLELMDGSRTEAEIVEVAVAEFPHVVAADVEEAIAALTAAGHLQDAAAPMDPVLDPADRERYSRNDAYFSWVDEVPRPTRFHLQARLKQSTVAVLGLGGSGSTLAMALAATGVGALRLADDDVVELSNLNRQVLYAEHDIGSAKVDAAAHRIRAVSSSTQVATWDVRLDSAERIEDIAAGSDLVALCADAPHPDILCWTDDACRRLGIPWVTSFYSGPVVSAMTFVPGETPCYRCYERSVPRQHHLGDEVGQPLLGLVGESAAIASTAAVAGHLAALEVVYRLVSMPTQTAGRAFFQNLLRFDQSYWVDAVSDPACERCGEGHDA